MIEKVKKIGIKKCMIVGFIFGVLVFEIFFLFFYSPAADLQAQSLESHTATIIEACKDAEHRPTCYEEKVPPLLSELTIQDIFKVVRLMQEHDVSYQFCHVLGHKLGELEVAKDPQNWFDVIPQCPMDGLCSNGCVHGAVVERFSKEVLTDTEIEEVIPDLSIACEAREGYTPSPLDQAICYHGLGHLAVHITEAQVKKSLEICDQIASKNDGRNYDRVCSEGVFMQFFQPLEPEDFALIDKLDMELTKETLSEFCSTYSRTTEEEGACMREGWPLFREEIQTADGIVNFCALSPETEIDKCYDTALSILGRSSLNDPDKPLRVCSGLPKERQGTCFAIAGTAIIEEDRRAGKEAATFCQEIPDETNRSACFNRLVQLATYNFNPDDPNLMNMCTELPSPWKEECINMI